MSKPSKQWQSVLAIDESLTGLMATIRSLELLAEQEESLLDDFDVACRLADDGRDAIKTMRKHLCVFQQAERQNGQDQLRVVQ
jgi:hypothetical protein